MPVNVPQCALLYINAITLQYMNAWMLNVNIEALIYLNVYLLQCVHVRRTVTIIEHTLLGTRCNIRSALSRGETDDPVRGSFINLMKLPNEGTLVFFGTSIKPFHVLMSFLWSCDKRMSFMMDSNYKT